MTSANVHLQDQRGSVGVGLQRSQHEESFRLFCAVMPRILHVCQSCWQNRRQLWCSAHFAQTLLSRIIFPHSAFAKHFLIEYLSECAFASLFLAIMHLFYWPHGAQTNEGARLYHGKTDLKNFCDFVFVREFGSHDTLLPAAVRAVMCLHGKR